ncbi:hypothetical protein BKA70DRAFT_1418637 [Coprinopsis sp. MPI-PUGE-AT-0042]|nr:hypothetical protein BKA70DRAFT_1418637 [Coprinopsis sp. MPI-PUGE-AT-0042]
MMAGNPQHDTNIPVNPPLPSLPSELIAEVMKACFSDALDHKERLFFINLRSVCGSWRATAFSTPDLWAGLSITLSDELHRVWRDTPADRSIVRWLDRAGDRPLTFKVIRPLATFPRRRETITINEKELVGQIYASALRGNRNWYRLHLPTMEEYYVPYAFLEQFDVYTDSAEVLSRSVGGPWKMLKHLQIDILLDWADIPRWRYEWPLQSHRLDFHAPALASLEVTFVGVDDCWGSQPIMSVSHNTLRKLVLFVRIENAVISAVGIVKNLPLLEDLTITLTISIAYTERLRNSPPIINANVKRLTLINYANSTFDVFTLPNLRHLSLRGLTPKHDNVKQLVSFLSRSECHQLQELSVHLRVPQFKPKSWRKHWAPAYEVMGLKEQSISEARGAIQEGTWAAV